MAVGENGTTFTDLYMRDATNGLTIAVFDDSVSDVYLVLASVPHHFHGNQHYGYKYNIAKHKKVTGRNATRVTFNGGEFKQSPNSTEWKEINLEGKVAFSFRELQRDDWSVYLHDSSRNANIQLDLHREMISFGNGNAARADLYAIKRAWPHNL